MLMNSSKPAAKIENNHGREKNGRAKEESKCEIYRPAPSLAYSC